MSMLSTASSSSGQHVLGTVHDTIPLKELKCGKVKIFGNRNNKLRLHPQ
jgi:hypothetical protein